jgi:hypothetical protein
MKYLKNYRVFEDKKLYDEIHKVIEDILLDLQDDGFEVRCNYFASNQHASYEIRIRRDIYTKFTWDDISTTMNRIYDYLIQFEEKLTFSFIRPIKGEHFGYASDNPDKNWILTKDTLEKSFSLYYNKLDDDIIVYYDLGVDPYWEGDN